MNANREGNERHYQYGKHMVAGAASGLFTRVFSQPLDVLKVRLQLQVEPVTVFNPKSKYKSLGQAVKCIYVEEGITAFWKGLNPALCLSLTYATLQFTSFEMLSKCAWTRVSKSVSEKMWSRAVINFSCGAVSGVVATVGSFPFDVVRTRMIGQGNFRVYRGLSDAMREMFLREGVGSFYKGLLPNIIHICPSTGLKFVFYKMVDDSWSDDNQTGYQAYGNLLGGILIGFGAKLVGYPLDVIKKRLQVQGFEEARRHFGSFPTCSGAIHCVRTVLREEGFTAFYKGLIPCIAKSFVITSSYFLVYKRICTYLT